MEPVYVGWLSILPPIIAIGLALITKEVISSLMIGILSGTLIYTVAMGGNVVVDTVKNTFDLMAGRFDLNIILFLGLVGALVSLITMAGGSRAYGSLMNKKLNKKRAKEGLAPLEELPEDQRAEHKPSDAFSFVKKEEPAEEKEPSGFVKFMKAIQFYVLFSVK